MEAMNDSNGTVVVGMPRIGDPAPQFEAATTLGTLKLEDFKGSWLILFSHPADFTPVCTTEFIGFANIQDELRGLNCELMGLSIDSTYSHIAWVRNIEQNMGVKITFPIIADLNKEVAGLYGMINPGESKTETSRCVFIIDDKQVIRAIIYYPLTSVPASWHGVAYVGEKSLQTGATTGGLNSERIRVRFSSSPGSGMIIHS